MDVAALIRDLYASNKHLNEQIYMLSTSVSKDIAALHMKLDRVATTLQEYSKNSIPPTPQQPCINLELLEQTNALLQKFKQSGSM